MHTLGKVLAFMVVIASLLAAVFTAKLVQVRNSWTAKTLAAKKKYADLVPKIEQLEAQIDSLKSELFRGRELWGAFWPAVQTQVMGPDGSVQIGIGSDQGIRDKQLLYGFEISPDGTSSSYRGSFTVTAVQNAAANLKPNWRATPDEVSKWTPGPTPWRWRNAIPSGYQETFERQLLTLVKHEETLKARMATLKNQNELQVKANESLRQREAELVGGELLGKPTKVEQEFKEGLVVAIEKAEEDRNKVLIHNDELRRKVLKTQAEIEELQAENIELVKKLPETGQSKKVTQKLRRDVVTQKDD